MDPGNAAEHNRKDDDEAVEHNQNEDNDSDETDSEDGSSSSSSNVASIERKKQLIRQADTSTWGTTGWRDAWESTKLVLDEGFQNAKRRRLAYKVLTALKDAKIEAIFRDSSLTVRLCLAGGSTFRGHRLVFDKQKNSVPWLIP